MGVSIPPKLHAYARPSKRALEKRLSVGRSLTIGSITPGGEEGGRISERAKRVRVRARARYVKHGYESDGESEG